MQIKKPRLLFGGLFLAALAVTGSVFVGIVRNEAHAVTARDTKTTYLLAGLDEAAENTDVLALATLDAGKKEVFLLQIPRDTYFVKEGKGGKINRLFHLENEKNDRKKSAENMCKQVEEVFGIPIDGYLFFSTEAVMAAVDALGGVRVPVMPQMAYTDSGTPDSGEQTLSGKEAVDFLRYRAGYTEGDLGRLDAQLVFLSCFYSRLKETHSLPEYLALYQKVAPKLLTNLSANDIIRLVSVYLKSGGNFSLSAARLPGEACRVNGVWYYVAKRRAAEQLLKTCGLLSDARCFDRERRLTERAELTFTNIYEDKNGNFPVYTQEEMEKLRPLHKDTAG